MNNIEMTAKTLHQARENMQDAMIALNNMFNELGRISSRAVSLEDAAALETKTATLRAALEAQIASLSEEVARHIETYED